MLSFWQVQDRNKVIMALQKGKREIFNTIPQFFFLVKSQQLACVAVTKQSYENCHKKTVHLLLSGIFVLQLLKEPAM